MATQRDAHNRPVIVLTGGGSGGHIVPVLAVARALKRQQPTCHLVYVAQKGDKLGDLVRPGGEVDEVVYISGGKWRRYHGEGWRQLFDVVTMAKNVRDFFRVLRGTIQSWRLLGKLRPDGVFIKGAYVGVPIGWAAGWRRIPYVTLDLDAIPSLANRLIAKHAKAHAVALPKENYPYPPDKTFYVGVPIAETYRPVTPSQQHSWRQALGLAEYEQLILAVGGGLGAARLNSAVAGVMPQLLQLYPKLGVVHVVGRDHADIMTKQYDELLSQPLRTHVVVKGFLTDIYRYSGAADVVVSRAGATSLAEFAAQAKPCVIIPNPRLTAGHQLRNAEQLAAHGAIRVVHETAQTKDELLTTLRQLLTDPPLRTQLGATLHNFAQPDAADKLARLLLDQFGGRP